MRPWSVATGRSAGTPDGAAATPDGSGAMAGVSLSAAAAVADSSPSEASLSSAARTLAAMTHRQIAIASARAHIRSIGYTPENLTLRASLAIRLPGFNRGMIAKASMLREY